MFPGFTLTQGSLDSYPTPEDPVRADPEEFEYLLVGHSEQAITFLERLADPHTPNRQPLSPRLYTTLLAEYLHQYSLAPEGVCGADAASLSCTVPNLSLVVGKKPE